MKRTIGILLLTVAGFGIQAQNLIAAAELEAKNVDEVRIDASFVDVYIEDGSTVYFKGAIYGNGDEGDYEFETDIVGTTLVVKVLNNKKGQVSWKSNNIKTARIDLIISDDIRLDIETSSGDIKGRGLRTSSAKFEASSGDITLNNIVANLQVETSSGDIEIDGLMGDSEIESTSGDQELYNLKGDMKTIASSGDITVSKFEGGLQLEASSGDIEVNDGVGTLEIETTSGNIDGVSIKLNGDASFDSTSGDISMKFTNELEDLSFDLRATSGDLSVGNRSSEKRLLIERGGYTVTGVSSSGEQEYN